MVHAHRERRATGRIGHTGRRHGRRTRHIGAIGGAKGAESSRPTVHAPPSECAEIVATTYLLRSASRKRIEFATRLGEPLRTVGRAHVAAADRKLEGKSPCIGYGAHGKIAALDGVAAP